MAKIVFIGLGVMGLPMAKNLIARGHEVVGADLSERSRGALIEAGGTATTPADLSLEGADVVFTMLPSGTIVKSVFDDVILPKAAPGTILIDSSSIDLETTKSIAAKGEAKGLVVVDAPVSGGPEAAASGKLSLMVGATEQAFVKAKPFLDEIGANVSLFGDNGAGQVAKACHNMIVGITALGVYEGFALAKKCGLDGAQFYELCNGAAAQSWVLHNRCPEPGVVSAAPSSNNFAPGFASQLMSKDLGLAQAAAQSAGLETPFGRQAAERFAAFVEAGNGGLDFSAISKTMTGDN